MTLLSDIYKYKFLRTMSKLGWVRPTIGQHFLSSRDFTRVSTIVSPLTIPFTNDSNFILEDDSSVGTADNVLKLKTAGLSFEVATWDPNNAHASLIFSNGNNTVENSQLNQNCLTTKRANSGKYYWEILYGDIVSLPNVGVWSFATENDVTLPNKQLGTYPYSVGISYNGYLIRCMGPSSTTDKVSTAGYIGSTGGGDVGGNVIGVALNLDDWEIAFSLNGVWSDTAAIPSNRHYMPAVSALGTGGDHMYHARFAPDSLQYSTPNGFTSGFGNYVPAYPTTQAYYVTTTRNSNLNLGVVEQITSTSISITQPNNTNIKGLVSFDNKQTWKKWNGSSWQAHSGGLSNLNTGNTITEIESGLTGFNPTITDTYVDFAFDLSTTDSEVTPEINSIELNFNVKN